MEEVKMMLGVTDKRMEGMNIKQEITDKRLEEMKMMVVGFFLVNQYSY